jgi:hypothetical protein
MALQFFHSEWSSFRFGAIPSRVARCFFIQTKNPNLGKFWKASDWKMLIYFMAIWNSLRTFGVFFRPSGTFCVHLVLLVSCTMKNLATLIPSLSDVLPFQKGVLVVHVDGRLPLIIFKKLDPRNESFNCQISATFSP